MKDTSGIPAAIIIGSLLISVSILISAGALKFKNNNSQATVSASSAPIASAEQTKPTTNLNVSYGKLPIKGDENAKVAIIEFADFRCPFCENFYKQAEQNLFQDYVDSGKVKFAFRHFAFLGPASTTASNASECANEQGKFWDYHDWLYKNQPSESDTSMYNTDKLTAAATSLGLDGNKFKTCLDSTKFGTNLTTDQSDGEAVGVTGTPSFIIGKAGPNGIESGKLIVGAQPYSVFKSTLDALLK